MRKNMFWSVCFLLFTSFLGAQALVNVVCSKKGSLVYVDGVQKGVIAKKPTAIFVSSGKHEVMVAHILDEDWQEVQRQKVVLKDDDVATLNFALDLEKISKKTNKSSADNFTKKGNVVYDEAAQLVWQDNKAVVKIEKNWFDADLYCASLSIDGRDAWRVPTYDELITIVDYTKHTLATMPAFEHIASEYYWSSNEDEKDTKKGKNIYFGNGCPNANLKKKPYFIRCVHSLR